MSKLEDLRLALKQLEELGLPVSHEQKMALKNAEDEDFENNVIPAIKSSLADILGKVGRKVKLVVDYNGKEEIDVHKISTSQTSTVPDRDLFGFRPRQKSNGKTLRVTYPDGRQVDGKGIVVLTNIIEEVGPELVHEMDIKCGGIPLVDDHLSDGIYRDKQKRLSGGYYLMPLSDAERKKKMIETISNNLSLGLKVDILDANGNIIERPIPQRDNRKKIKVITPEGNVFFNNIVWETLRDAVLYAGADNVKKLGLESVGLPLIDDHITPGIYESAQHEIAPNVYLNTSADTKHKLQQIQEISNRLNLGLKVEIV